MGSSVVEKSTVTKALIIEGPSRTEWMALSHKTTPDAPVQVELTIQIGTLDPVTKLYSITKIELRNYGIAFFALEDDRQLTGYMNGSRGGLYL